MANGMKENEFVLRCECGTTGHMAILTHDPDDTPPNTKLAAFGDDWYLHVCLDERMPLWKRIKIALAYVWGRRGHTFHEVVLKPEDIAAMRDFINRRINPSGE